MKQHILVSALDWGYGHVTRTNIRVTQFLQEGHTVTIACSQNQLRLWQSLQPQLQIIAELPDNSIELSGFSMEMIWLMKKNNRFRKNWKTEREWIEKYTSSHRVDHIFSDNRYGFYSPKHNCTLLTHQVNLQGPWPWKKIAQWALNNHLKNFNCIEIPDYSQKPRLSGILGSTSRNNVLYIGPLAPTAAEESNFKLNQDCVLFLSGPEPQRTNFAQLIHNIWPSSHSLAIIGDCNLKCENKNVSLLGFLNTAEKLAALNQAKTIICRSGYTTLMELHALNKKAILVPTTGQWEQEYLARYWNSQFHFPSIKQHKLSTEFLISHLKF